MTIQSYDDPATLSVLDELAAAFRTCTEALVAALGERAPVRHRPRRVAKKLNRRGGYLRYDSLGALLAIEDLEVADDDA